MSELDKNVKKLQCKVVNKSQAQMIREIRDMLPPPEYTLRSISDDLRIARASMNPSEEEIRRILSPERFRFCG